MIDCENEVYTLLANSLRETFDGIELSGDISKVPTSFPHVSIVMTDCPTMFSVMDSDGEYEVSIPVFDINIYTNSENRKKSEAKAISKHIDSILKVRNFRRMSLAPVMNRDDPTIYRIAARYRVATDGHNFYRR